MRLRRSKGAVAVTAAVIAGALGGASGGFAAPPAPGAVAGDGSDGGPAGEDRARRDAAGPPAVYPRPQTMRAKGAGVALGDEVVLVAGPDADTYAVEALRTQLRAAGVRQIRTVAEDAPLPAGRSLVVRAGKDTASGGSPATHRGPASALDDALRALGAPARGDLPSGGYRLAVGSVDGRGTVALAGVGEDGLFHAVQTLRQLTEGRRIAGVLVRDWPGTPVRGLTEGFYGTPWTPEQRLAQLDFMGRTKQNRYLYAPGDDPYRLTRWREPYPAAQRADFRALAERARRNHVTPAWAVAPGQSMCLSSERDLAALNRKIDAMRALGIRAFQLQFQDVSYSEWHCDRDADTFGSGPEAAARAQAHVANAVARHLAARHPDVEPLSLMPTEYYQDGATKYRTALGRELSPAVQVAWTGVGVVPRTITGRELRTAREAFGAEHALITMDNYPVNDFAEDRIHLGPYTGREPAVAAGSSALLANAMEQPAASRIALFTAADFAWNPRDYRPAASWQAAIDALAGRDPRVREAVRALAGNDASSVLGTEESGYLKPLTEAFWQGRRSDDRTRSDRAAEELRDAFTVMREAPERLRDSELSGEVAPWIAQLAAYGRAGEAAVDMLRAQSHSDGARAWQARRALADARRDIAASAVTVGKGTLDAFLDRTEAAYANWTGTGGQDDAAQQPAGARGERSLPVTGARPLAAVTVQSEPGARGTVEARLPGGGWQRLGALDPGGWTQLDARRLHTDTVRVRAAGGDEPHSPGDPDSGENPVQDLAAWYADVPAADLRLDRRAADLEPGGRAAARLSLTAQRPGDVRGKVTAKAPRGLTVRAPEGTVLPRGREIDVPLEITADRNAKPGRYEIPVTFAGRSTRLTVTVFRAPTGENLARGARATASGEESPAFPAAAAVDGDAGSRWSSPAEDGAWWQMKLPRPARLGELVLRWEDAYASAYRIQVSPDGRDWRTAATVEGGRGGRESVRLDAADVRFVRVVADERAGGTGAAEYGVSLWSVEAYGGSAQEKDAEQDGRKS